MVEDKVPALLLRAEALGGILAFSTLQHKWETVKRWKTLGNSMFSIFSIYSAEICCHIYFYAWKMEKMELVNVSFHPHVCSPQVVSPRLSLSMSLCFCIIYIVDLSLSLWIFISLSFYIFLFLCFALSISHYLFLSLSLGIFLFFSLWKRERDRDTRREREIESEFIPISFAAPLLSSLSLSLSSLPLSHN